MIHWTPTWSIGSSTSTFFETKFNPFQSQAHNAKFSQPFQKKMIEWCREKWLFNQLSSEQTIYCRILHTVWHISGERPKENIEVDHSWVKGLNTLYCTKKSTASFNDVCWEEFSCNFPFWIQLYLAFHFLVLLLSLLLLLLLLLSLSLLFNLQIINTGQTGTTCRLAVFHSRFNTSAPKLNPIFVIPAPLVILSWWSNNKSDLRLGTWKTLPKNLCSFWLHILTLLTFKGADSTTPLCWFTSVDAIY